MASYENFGQLDALLQADGAPVMFFNNCTYGKISTVTQTAHRFPSSIWWPYSMDGLITRACLAGKGAAAGEFASLANPQVRKLITLATPHFGSFLALNSGPQLSELGSTYFFDNQFNL